MMFTPFHQRPVPSVLLRLAAFLLFGFALIESVKVFAAWWRNELTEPSLVEWLWIGLLPVLIGIYLRFFSIFRPGCSACPLPEEERGPDRHP